MTALQSQLRIGPWPAELAWSNTHPSALPAGLLVDHGDHTVLLPWAPVARWDGPVFTLDSLVPLTIVEQVTCVICGVSGRIEQGAWLPAEGGVARG